MTTWFANRLARVRVSGTLGRCRTFKEGLPQGSVPSTILFTIVINNLLDKFDDSTMASAYADDLAIACRGANKELITAKLQAEVDKMYRWSEQLNTNKCAVAVFSNDSADSGWTPPVLLGVDNAL